MILRGSGLSRKDQNQVASHAGGGFKSHPVEAVSPSPEVADSPPESPAPSQEAPGSDSVSTSWDEIAPETHSAPPPVDSDEDETR